MRQAASHPALVIAGFRRQGLLDEAETAEWSSEGEARQLVERAMARRATLRDRGEAAPSAVQMVSGSGGIDVDARTSVDAAEIITTPGNFQPFVESYSVTYLVHNPWDWIGVNVKQDIIVRRNGNLRDPSPS